LKTWVEKAKSQYSNIEFVRDDINVELKKYELHEWNNIRFKILGEIRQRSLNKTLEYDCDYYFIADVDNFIYPHTLKDLVSLQLPLVAPLLKRINCDETLHQYANLHYGTDANGYYKESSEYHQIINYTIRGLFEVDVIHCTYLIRSDVIKYLTYDDGSGRHEYVIFAHSARKNGIPQYIDNRKEYGVLTMENHINKTPYLISLLK
jgi:hypothetical protein